jgi:hypothetical protein
MLAPQPAGCFGGGSQRRSLSGAPGWWKGESEPSGSGQLIIPGRQVASERYWVVSTEITAVYTGHELGVGV